MNKKPNIIVIFTDNQQASTLGCYGNDEIHTPNLDRFAQQGVKFDNAFCPNAFCSPCRASLLTGMLPSQHGVHSWIDDRNMPEWPAGWHALDGMRTLPTLLKEDGYTTALVGKYHLGEPTSAAEGFDHWVTLEDGHVRSFYRNKIFDNGKVYTQPGHSVDFFTDKACEFMAEQTSTDQPFFLYLPYPAPYGHWPATKESDKNRHTERYADCPINSVPRQAINKKAVDGFLMVQSDSTADLDFSMLMRAPNDLATLRNYYSQVSMVDDGVGEIMKTLEELGIEDNTLLVFTTDHGLSVGQHGFWGHGGSSFPSNLHRAAHSIPLIVKQPGVTKQGDTSALMVSNMDLYATILEHAGIAMPDIAEPIPSRSLMPILKGESLTHWGDDAVFSEQEETRVIRTQKWALFKRYDGPNNRGITDELFDIENDHYETNNLSGQSEYKEIEAELNHMLLEFFRQHVREEADLWIGGVPIQNSVRKTFWKEAWGEDWSPVYSYDK
ncbi:sulfatase-like hydrolase/transferase [Granulosicoccus sp.]|nr:sulfatase-like hydrolase/transferase [Granulosicoccus sp.]MDB4223858.1 sulfatase-like hydrolase/transferase [Granulosicoccus sp.]